MPPRNKASWDQFSLWHKRLPGCHGEVAQRLVWQTSSLGIVSHVVICSTHSCVSRAHSGHVFHAMGMESRLREFSDNTIFFFLECAVFP